MAHAPKTILEWQYVFQLGWLWLTKLISWKGLFSLKFILPVFPKSIDPLISIVILKWHNASLVNKIVLISKEDIRKLMTLNIHTELQVNKFEETMENLNSIDKGRSGYASWKLTLNYLDN